MAKKQNHINRLLSTIEKVQKRAQAPSCLLPAANIAEYKKTLSVPQEGIFDSTASVTLFLSGQGGGKTYLAGGISAERIQNFPDARGMICANTYLQLTQSTLFRIREVWKAFGWLQYNEYTGEGDYVVGIKPPKEFNTASHNYDRYHNIISFRNGAVIYYGSLDNYKALDGKEVAWAILDETKDTKEDAVKDVILGRLRQVSSMGYNPLLLITSPAKERWLNEWFSLEDYETEIKTSIFSETTYFKKDIDNKRVVIASAYHNARNLPPDYLANQSKNLSAGRQEMLIYGSPFSRSGGEFYKGFDRNKHVGEAAYNKDLPLHISFDFNVNPYITLCIWQMVLTEDCKELRQINEICLGNPRNNTIALCRAFVREYQGHQAGVFVYGDPSGKQRDTRTERGYNDYTLIAGELQSFKPVFRVEQKAPAVVMRANFINQIFEQALYGIHITINKKCQHTIADYTYLKEAADGTKHKERSTKNGVSFEKYGHCFSGETLIRTNQGDKEIRLIKVGDMVLTRKGYQKVLRTYDNGIRTVRKYQIGSTRITCTKDHLFFTKEFGFKRVSELMGLATFCILQEKSSQWKEKLLPITITDLGLPDTRSQKGEQTAFITQGGSRLKTSAEKSDTTSINTCSKWALLPKVAIFTIWTATQTTTIFQTLSALVQRLMPKSIMIQLAKKKKKKRPQFFSLKPFQHQKNGTAQKRGLLGTNNTARPLQINTKKPLLVQSVALWRSAGQAEGQSFAPTDAENGLPPEHFEQRERVYDIEVEGEHEYFANGILVHNCSDANDYLLTTAFKVEFQKYLRGGEDRRPILFGLFTKNSNR